MKSCFLSLLFVLSAFADDRSAIGMTDEQARAKYGVPVSAVKGNAPSEKALLFERNGIIIVVEMLHGHVGRVSYARQDKGLFNEAQAETLLHNNGDGWQQLESANAGIENWRNGSLLALHDVKRGTLIIMTKEFMREYKELGVDALKGL